ncbi:hypothetical protein BBJ28_00000225 [Nothophytophthora sp. Chile5]|nr:hypothetical protein BBJ28_00000225 [Nothophytophthora sp. Chile5]
MSGSGSSSSSTAAARRWNIAETHTVVKMKAAAGDKFVNNYRLLHTLGQGRFGKVKLCERLANICSSSSRSNGQNSNIKAGELVVGQIGSGALGEAPALPPPMFAQPKARQFAMKIFSKKMLRKMKDYCAEPAHEQRKGELAAVEDALPARMRVVTALDRVRDEIEIMRSLYHRNIVLLFEVIEDNSDKIYMVLEYMAQGPCIVYRPDTKDFYSHVTGGPLSEELARAYLRDILLGLEYLHQRRICHRDIKASHHSAVLLAAKFGNDTAGAIDDANLTQEPVQPVLMSDTVGTYQFLAPECCSGEPYDPFKVDIWAVGVVLYIFLFGKLPFASESTRELFDEITRAEIVLPEVEEGSGRDQQLRPECRDLLVRLLEKDPGQRITITEAHHHPWFVNEDEEDEPLSF